MTEANGDRPQDVGRSHKRAGELAPETAELLEAYRAAMRAELAELLEEIRPATGQQGFDGTLARPKLEERRALWDLGIKLARELAAGADAGLAGPTPAADPTMIQPRRQAPRLSARDRRSLGG